MTETQTQTRSIAQDQADPRVREVILDDYERRHQEYLDRVQAQREDARRVMDSVYKNRVTGVTKNSSFTTY